MLKGERNWNRGEEGGGKSRMVGGLKDTREEREREMENEVGKTGKRKQGWKAMTG